MANVSLKTDFKDGEKLFGQQLNNNFAVIKAALEAMNRIAWQDDPDDSVTAFRGTTEEINQRDIIDGQLLYDTTTGETYIDVGSQRISTGSGNAIHIGSDTPTNPSTQIWIDPNEPLQLIGTEVVNSMEGTESNKAPSVQAVKNYMNIDNVYSTDEIKTNKVWINNAPIYRKVVEMTTPAIANTWTDTGMLITGDFLGVGLGYVNVSANEQYPMNEQSDIYFYHNKNNGKLLIQCTDYYKSKEIKVAMEYTKTNDSVGGE